MYKRIIVALDASPTDEPIIEHITRLAKTLGSHVILLRVAHSHTRDQMSHEAGESEEYVRKVAERMAADGVDVETLVVPGEPADEIIRLADSLDADLLAMSTHGHRGIYDLLYGSVASKVRHRVSIPVLFIRGPAASSRNEEK